MKRGILVLFGLLFLVALAFTTFMNAEDARNNKESLSQLAQQVGVPFPPEARLLGARRERGIDEYVMFKVELPAALLPAFMGTLPFSDDDARPGDNAPFGADDGFFDPSTTSLEHFYEGYAAERALKLGITPAKNGWVTVYVVSFQT